MGMSFGSRLKHAWNAFTGTDYTTYQDVGPGYSSRPDRIRLTRGNERSIITSVYNRIALDVAALNVQHIRLDENGRFLSVIQDGLNTYRRSKYRPNRQSLYSGHCRVHA